MGQTAAADGGQQLVRRFRCQHKAHIARRLLQRLEQGIGRDRIHLLGRVDQHRLAAPSRRSALRELHGIAHGIDANFLAGLALLVVNFRLRLFTQRPAARHHVHLGHQHKEVSMGMHIDAVTACAMTTRSAIGTRLLAQPSTHQRHAQFKLPHAGWSLQQPCMTALRQQTLALLCQPGSECAGGCAHAAAPDSPGR